MNSDTRTAHDPAVYEPLVKVEDHHFWFRARNRVIGAMAARLAAQLSPGYRVLEVNPIAGAALGAMLGLERPWLVGRRHLPTGSSLIVIAHPTQRVDAG